jgi:hypothetical protein
MGLLRALLGPALCLVAMTQAASADLAGSAPDASAKAVLPGCRALVDTKGVAKSPEVEFCGGTIDALLYLGELLPQDYSYCVPLGLPRYQVVQAIVEEIEAVYPSVEKQLFKGLALEVLHYRWPCRDLSR